MRAGNGCPREIIIVDNASQNPLLELLEEMPLVHIVRNRTNRGVARARNQAMRLARGKAVCILDADTEPPDDLLNSLERVMFSHDDVGIVGPALCSERGELLESCRAFPTLPSKLGRRFPWLFRNTVRTSATAFPRSVDRPHEVDYVIGACQLIRAEAIRRIGFLDERIFYGPEDVDFCLRMWQNGYRVLFEPRVRVIHAEQRYTVRNPLSLLSLRHGMALTYFFLKHRYLFSRPPVRQS